MWITDEIAETHRQILRRSTQGNPESRQNTGKKNILEESEASCTHNYNIKHSTSSCQFNKNSYTKDLFISVPVT